MQTNPVVLQQGAKYQGGYTPKYNYSPHPKAIYPASNNLYRATTPQYVLQQQPWQQQQQPWQQPPPQPWQQQQQQQPWQQQQQQQAPFEEERVKRKRVHKTKATPLSSLNVARIVVAVLVGALIVGAITAAVVVVVGNNQNNQNNNDTAVTTAPPLLTSKALTTAPLFCNNSTYVLQCINSTKCLLSTDLCNGYEDCPGGEDERSCQCKAEQYQCQGARCLDRVFMCDGVRDCPSGDDEGSPSCVKCSPAEFSCMRNNTCISLQERCDGVVNCGDASDERGCLSVASAESLVMAVVGGGSGLYTCVDRFNQTMAQAVCRMSGFKDYIQLTNVSSSTVTASSYVTVESINDVKGTPVVNSKVVNACDRLLFLNCSEYKCGTRTGARDFGQYIVNGYKALKGAWPWHANLEVGDSECGAVLIDRSFVLTAAHCVVFSGVTADIGTITVTLGMVRMDDPTRQTFGVTKIVVHPLYNDSSDSVYNDLALLELSAEATLTDDVNTICMPTQQEQMHKYYKTCVSTGFGKATKDIYPDNLLQTRLNIYSDEECDRMYPGDRSSENATLCVGSIPGIDRNNICFGDSGGPLGCMDEKGRWFLVGIHSFVFSVDGLNYSKKDYRFCQAGVVASVVRYNDWITEEMHKMLN